MAERLGEPEDIAIGAVYLASPAASFVTGKLFEDIRAGLVTEAFGSGTAAVITPVGRLCYKDECQQLTGGRVGEITRRLYDTLTGIQRGLFADTHGWMTKLG